VRDAFADALPRSLEGGELLRALRGVIDGLLVEAEGIPALTARVAADLRSLGREGEH
jgi:hypothetical protein